MASVHGGPGTKKKSLNPKMRCLHNQWTTLSRSNRRNSRLKRRMSPRQLLLLLGLRNSGVFSCSDGGPSWSLLLLHS